MLLMKSFAFLKNILVFSLPVAIVCTGCDGKPADSSFSAKLDPAFSVGVSMTYGDINSEAVFQLTRYENGIWDATFQEPASLAGVTLSFENNAVSANYKGLSFTVPKSALPAKMMILCVTDVLDSMDSIETLPYEQASDGTWKLDGESECGSYTLTFSENGILTGFNIPSQPLTLEFTDYTVYSAPETTVPPETTTLSSDTTSHTIETTTSAAQ